MAEELSLYVLGPELLYFISEYLTPTCLKCYITHLQMSVLKHTSIQTWQKRDKYGFFSNSKPQERDRNEFSVKTE